MKEKKTRKIKFTVIILISSIVLIAMIVFSWMHHQLTIEDYCMKVAQQSVTKYGDNQVPVTMDDRKQAPGAVNTNNGMIYRGFSVELKCEREHTYFGFF